MSNLHSLKEAITLEVPHPTWSNSKETSRNKKKRNGMIGTKTWNMTRGDYAKYILVPADCQGTTSLGIGPPIRMNGDIIMTLFLLHINIQKLRQQAHCPKPSSHSQQSSQFTSWAHPPPPPPPQRPSKEVPLIASGMASIIATIQSFVLLIGSKTTHIIMDVIGLPFRPQVLVIPKLGLDHKCWKRLAEDLADLNHKNRLNLASIRRWVSLIQLQRETYLTRLLIFNNSWSQLIERLKETRRRIGPPSMK